MGGRGGTSSAGSAYSSEKPVSKVGARVMYHAALHSGNLEKNSPEVKKNSKYEKIAQSKDYSFFENKQRREVEHVGYYFEKRIENVQAKIAKLGSIDKAFENQTLLKEYRALRDANIAVHEKLRTFKPTGSFNRIDPTLEHRQTTTTYENARKRREKNFEAWWNGSSK